jgi:hypothetical protein
MFITEENSQCSIPQVGDVWRHADRSSLYMRIDDINGFNALRLSNVCNVSFYSVNLNTGQIEYTNKDCTPIKILFRVSEKIKLTRI